MNGIRLPLVSEATIRDREVQRVELNQLGQDHGLDQVGRVASVISSHEALGAAGCPVEICEANQLLLEARKLLKHLLHRVDLGLELPVWVGVAPVQVLAERVKLVITPCDTIWIQHWVLVTRQIIGVIVLWFTIKF